MDFVAIEQLVLEKVDTDIGISSVALLWPQMINFWFRLPRYLSPVQGDFRNIAVFTVEMFYLQYIGVAVVISFVRVLEMEIPLGGVILPPGGYQRV